GHWSSVDEDLTCVAVQGDEPELEDSFCYGGSATQHRAGAGEQLLELERLRQVVVRARVEAPYPVVDVVPCREHDDGNVAAQSELTAHLDSVQPGQVEVKDDQVRPSEGNRVQRGPPVPRELDVEAFIRKAKLHEVQDRLFVVDDQNSQAAHF